MIHGVAGCSRERESEDIRIKQKDGKPDRRSAAASRDVVAHAVNRSALTTILLSLLFYTRIMYVCAYYDVLLRKISRQHNITISRRV